MNALVFLRSALLASTGLFMLMFAARLAIMLAFSNRRVYLKKTTELFKAYWLGARFDLKIIAGINLLPIMYTIVLYSWHNASFFQISFYVLFAYYFVAYLVVIIMLGIDIGFFSYFNEHINYLIFGFFDDDTKALIDTMRKNYNVPLIVLGILALLVGVFFTVWWLIVPTFNAVYYDSIWNVTALVLLFIINFLLLRGTLASLPLGLIHARVSSNDFLNKLCMNGIFSFFKALKQRRESKRGTFSVAEKYGYLDKREQALDMVATQKETASITKAITQSVPHDAYKAENPPHVVLVMMESFAAQILSLQDDSMDLMAGLTKHFNEDYVFNNFTSDGQGTIESFLALVCGLPHRANTNNFTESALINSQIKSSAALAFATAGYETSAIYGGSLGWRNLGVFLEKQGFDHVEGDMHIKEKIPLKGKGYDHCWGVHDEYLYDYLEYKLKNAQRPQFIVALTTSNHPPFEFPETYHAEKIELSPELQARLLCSKKIMQERLAVYQYSSAMTAKFLDFVKSSKFAENTIVALTGDHSFWGMYNYYEDEIFTKQTVPFYLYIPKAYQPAHYDKSRFASHKDILPTLYHLSLSDVNYLGLGNDVFDSDKITYALNSSEMIASSEGMVSLQPSCEFYTWTENNKVKNVAATPTLEALLEKYKASLSVTDMFLKEEH